MARGTSNESGPRTLEIPESDLYELYSTLADATEAAATGDTNACAHHAAEAKTQVRKLQEEYTDE